MLRVSIVLSITALGCGGSPPAAEAPAPAECPAPVALPEGGEVVEIALGNFHACARLRTGAIRCWGMNSNGQLGDGTKDNRHLPVAPLQVRDVVGLALGGSVSCAIVEGGSVWCWGHEISDLFGASHDAPVPTEVPALAGATQISLGFAHWCARYADGTARCSGEPDRGGTPAGGLSGVAEVVAGYSFSCARGDDGLARCWGWNDEGRLGGASRDERVLEPAVVVGLGPIDEIGAGFGNACARRTDGSVWCWGPGAAPAPVADLACAVDLALADQNACVRTGDGRARCWGKDAIGSEPTLFAGCTELEHVDTSGCSEDMCFETEPEVLCKRPTPVAAEGVAQVGIGMLHACVLVAGEARCWGSNFYGGLGDGTGVDRAEPTPVRLP